MAIVDILYTKSQGMKVLKKLQEGENPLSYMCKICSKRFVSGRALGGHMSSGHGPVSKAANIITQTEIQKTKRPRTSDDKSMDRDYQGELDGNRSNLIFAAERKPKRSWRFADRDTSFLLGCGFNSKPVDSSINCDLCWKEFSSWEGLFGHKNCHCETQQVSGDTHIEESHKHEIQDQQKDRSESDTENEIGLPTGNSSRFDKGKRSAIQVTNPYEQFGMETNTEVQEAAMCLVMLASGVNTAQNPQIQAGDKELESSDLKLPNTGSQSSKCISNKPKAKKIDGDISVLYDEVKMTMYKCTTCSKVFQSYQALGGHRSCHNKVMKGCSTQIHDDIIYEELNTGSDCQLPGNSHKPPPQERTKDPCSKVRDETPTIKPAAFSEKKSRVHACSMCHWVFPSSQALGVHMRCHSDIARASDTTGIIASNKETPIQLQIPAGVKLWDLNLPVPVDDDCNVGNPNNNLGGDAVDFDGAFYAQSHNFPYLQWDMGYQKKQGMPFYYYNNKYFIK